MKLARELFEYQVPCLRYALDKKRTFIADEVGLGKSVEALSVIAESEAFPALIVCPGYLKPDWASRVQSFLVGYPPISEARVIWQVVQPDHAPSPGTQVVVINYDLLERFERQLTAAKFRTIVFDESQYLKNKKAKRTKVAKRLAKNAEFVLCLSATPIESRPAELASQLDVMRRLQDFGGEWWFKQRYCVKHYDWCLTKGEGFCQCGKNRWGYWDFSGASNLEELSKKLRASCFIRRTKDEVQQYLPPFRRNVVNVEISNTEEYRKAKADFIQWMIENHGAEAAMRAYRAEAVTRMSKLKMLAVEGKLKAVEQWISDAVDSEPLVVFLWHHATSAALKRCTALSAYAPPVIDGDTPAAARAKIVSEFQAGQHRLLLVNIASGGLGIELTRASNCVFVELGWTPAGHDQAEGRLHRHGQSRPVTAWYLIAQDTIEANVHDLIERKRIIVNKVLDGSGSGEFLAPFAAMADGFDVERETALALEWEGKTREEKLESYG